MNEIETINTNETKEVLISDMQDNQASLDDKSLTMWKMRHSAGTTIDNA